MYIYSNPADANDPHRLPNIEVFHSSDYWENEEEGFYYWPCFPGCIPDAEAIGPFPTLEAAVEAAQSEE